MVRSTQIEGNRFIVDPTTASAVPTPDAGKLAFFYDTTGTLFVKKSDGSVVEIGALPDNVIMNDHMNGFIVGRDGLANSKYDAWTDFIGLGRSVDPRGYRAIAIGDAATTGHNHADTIAIGSSSQGEGYRGIGIGANARVSGNYSVAVGGNTTSYYDNAAVFGIGVNSRDNNTTTIGNSFGANKALLELSNTGQLVLAKSTDSGYSYDELNIGDNVSNHTIVDLGPTTFVGGDRGGNARGDNVIELQSSRYLQTEVASGDYSVAIGMDNLVAGQGTTVVGRGNIANTNATHSQLYGSGNSATMVSTIYGAMNNGTGDEVTIVGRSNTASGTYSTTIGYDNTTPGDVASVLGHKNNIGGWESVGVGFKNTVTGGDLGIAVGHTNTASSYGSAFGRNNTATHTDASVFGMGGKTRAANITSLASSNAGAIAQVEVLPDGTLQVAKSTNGGTSWTVTPVGMSNGSVASASKLTTSRTISLGGDVSGSTTFDGSSNVVINAQVANDSHDHTHMYVTDSRTVNTNPNAHGQQARVEFKERSAIQNPGDSGAYAGLLHISPWKDGNGGDTHQLAFTEDGSISYRHEGTSNSTWTDPWRKLYHEGNFNPATKFDKTGGSIGGNVTITPGGAKLHMSGENSSIVLGSAQSIELTTEISDGNLLEPGHAIIVRKTADNGQQEYKSHLVVEGNIYADSNKKVWHSGNFTPSAKADVHSHPYLPLSGGTLSGNVSLDRTGADSTFTVRADNSHVARVNVIGTGQGTGVVYVGQDGNYGGGVMYDGDNAPDMAGTGDSISFYRRTGGVDSEVFYYKNNGNDVTFHGNIYEGGTRLADKYMNATGDTMTGTLKLDKSGIVIDTRTNKVDGTDQSTVFGNNSIYWETKYKGSEDGINNAYEIHSHNVNTDTRMMRMTHDGVTNFEGQLKENGSRVWTQANFNPDNISTYGHWELRANGAAGESIDSGEAVNFKAGQNISVSRTGSEITITGTGADIAGISSTAVPGFTAVTDSSESTAFGSYANVVRSSWAQALGYSTQATDSDFATVVGQSSYVTGAPNATLIGNDNRVNSGGSYSVALGNNNTVNANHSRSALVGIGGKSRAVNTTYLSSSTGTGGISMLEVSATGDLVLHKSTSGGASWLEYEVMRNTAVGGDLHFGLGNTGVTVNGTGLLIGKNNSASSYDSTMAIGQSNSTNASDSMLVGYGNTASGTYQAVAVGRLNTISGSNDFASVFGQKGYARNAQSAALAATNGGGTTAQLEITSDGSVVVARTTNSGSTWTESPVGGGSEYALDQVNTNLVGGWENTSQSAYLPSIVMGIKNTNTSSQYGEDITYGIENTTDSGYGGNTVIGKRNNISSEQATIVVGHNNKMDVRSIDGMAYSNGILIGDDNYVNGHSAIAVGQGNGMAGGYNATFGHDNHTSKGYSAVLGLGGKATNNNATYLSAMGSSGKRAQLEIDGSGNLSLLKSNDNGDSWTSEAVGGGTSVTPLEYESTKAEYGSHITFPEGGTMVSGTSSLTGYLKITLPSAANAKNSMITIKALVSNDRSGDAFEVHLTGMVTPTGWSNVSATINSSNANHDYHVRFGTTGTERAIYIGDASTNWKYPQVVITDLIMGYGNPAPDGWKSGWNVRISGTGPSTSSMVYDNLPAVREHDHEGMFHFEASNALVGGNTDKGNARGNYAIDIQSYRDWNNMVVEGANSIGIGRSIRVTGSDSIAMGTGAKVSAAYTNSSISIGTGAETLAPGTIALGKDSNSLANDGIAIGTSTYVTNGAYSGISIGNGAISRLSGSISLGKYAVNDKQNSISIGVNARTNSKVAITMGMDALNDADNSIVIGNAAKATGISSISMGRWTKTFGQESVAIGQAADTTVQAIGGVALGPRATVQELGGIALGDMSHTVKAKAISIGYKSWAYQKESICVGTEAHTTGSGGYGIAIGYKAHVDAWGSMAIGREAVASHMGSSVIGKNGVTRKDYTIALAAKAPAGARAQLELSADGTLKVAKTVNGGYSWTETSVGGGLENTATGSLSIATGLSSTAGGSYSVAFGYGANAGSNHSNIVIGRSASSPGTYNVTMGYSSYTPNVYQVAIGYDAHCSTDSSVAIGRSARGYGNSSVCIGNSAYTNASYATAVGYATDAYGTGATAVGYSSYATNSSAAIGYDSHGTGLYSLAVGYSNISSGADSTSVGHDNDAVGTGSTAVGADNDALHTESTAVGKSNVINSVYASAFGRHNTVSTNAEHSTLVGSANVVNITGPNTGGKCVGVGFTNNLSDEGTIGVGSNNTTSAPFAMAFGAGNTVSGYMSTAVGYNNTCGEWGSGVFGYRSKVNGYEAYAIGAYTETLHDNTIVVGHKAKSRLNDTVVLGKGDGGNTISLLELDKDGGLRIVKTTDGGTNWSVLKTLN